MGFFDEQKNVDQYIKMAEGYDGRDLVAVLEKHLPAKSTILELGMGPGKDVDLLGQTYNVTGSDCSEVFLNYYRKKHLNADLLRLDAAEIETDRSFNCVYSNKVLQHLQKAELRHSFERQREVLTDGGLAMHSFWYGDGEEEFHGLLSAYYTEEKLLEIIGSAFEVVEMDRYKEMETGDSFYVVLQKK